jgi:hypothetical protein
MSSAGTAIMIVLASDERMIVIRILNMHLQALILRIKARAYFEALL